MKIGKTTYNVPCPDCGRVVIDAANCASDIQNEVVHGICPQCRAVLTWSELDGYLESFTPEGMTESGSPTCQVTITATNRINRCPCSFEHPAHDYCDGKSEVDRTEAIRSAIEEVYNARGDDVCWMDIDKIFKAAGLPVPDRSVGDKEAMMANCRRFVDTMCKGGDWLSYADLEIKYDELKRENEVLTNGMAAKMVENATVKKLMEEIHTLRAEVKRLTELLDRNQQF